MGKHEILYLGQEEVIAAGGLDMAAAIATMEEVFSLYGRGQCILPNKISLRWSSDHLTEEKKGRIMALPAYVGGNFHVAGIKWIPSVPANVYRGLPRATALIILNDPETGLPLAVLDGTVISAMRTGAVTGLGAKYLARTDAQVVVVIGCGVQARTQLQAILTVLKKVRKVVLFDVRADQAVKFAEEIRTKYGIVPEVAGSAEEAVREGDVVTTPTLATEPYVRWELLKPGCFFADVASHDACLDVYLRADKLVVDDWEEVKHYRVVALARAYFEGLIKDEQIYAELSEIITGQKPGREREDEVIVFRPIGLGIADVGEAYRIYRNALEKGLGTTLTLFERPVWL
ncbi:MAG: ornithine cyclodeaminase [Desulfotomaculales bacterium]